MRMTSVDALQTLRSERSRRLLLHGQLCAVGAPLHVQQLALVNSAHGLHRTALRAFPSRGFVLARQDSSSEQVEMCRVRGMTTRLRQMFFPAFRYHTPRTRAQATNLCKRLRRHAAGEEDDEDESEVPDNHYMLSGRQRGSAVHHQLEQLMVMPNATYAEAQSFLDGVARSVARMDMLPETRAAVLYFLNAGRGRLRPLLGEWPVTLRAVHTRNPVCATSADLLCYDATRRTIVVVEVKTGYNECFLRASGMMHGAMRAHSDSPCNQALLQAAFTAMALFEEHGQRATRDNAVVMHCTRANTVSTYHCSEQFWNDAVMAYTEFLLAFDRCALKA
jgi:hypothetical protein